MIQLETVLQHTRRLRVALLALACLSACKDITKPDPDNITVASGGTQSKIAGSASDEMVVSVTTPSGEPVAGATVTWSSPTGALVATTTTTDALGKATNSLSNVGTVEGQFEILAISGFRRVGFSITVVPEPPGRIEKFSSDPGNFTTGAADSVRVRVLNYLEQPRAGVTVTFSVTAGGGGVSPATAVTDNQGIAATRWSRTNAGTNTISASAPGYQNNPVAFNVNAVAQAVSLAYALKSVVVDSNAIASALTPVVRDGTGQTMLNQTITYVSRDPATATVDASGRITGVKSGQAVIVASMVTAANQVLRDSLLAIVANPKGIVLLADLPRFDLKTDTVFTVTVRADMRDSTEKLGSARVTVTWNPDVLTFVSHAEAGSNLGAAVNAASAPTGTLVIAFANAAGVAGAIELRRLTFRAAATKKSGSLAVLANEAFAAGTFFDLLAAATSVAIPLFTR